MPKVTASREEYEAAFATEAIKSYPSVDAWEERSGFAVDRQWLLDAARVLACPVKQNPPNWQHGRVVYSTLSAYLSGTNIGRSFALRCLDVGTAKGFSALCAARAILDAGVHGSITSVDVIDPDARARRNTVAEVDGLLTLRETLRMWPAETALIDFVLGKGENWLVMNRKRVHFAFVDGKHAYESVRKELVGLAGVQDKGDVTICDDLQVPGVERAVSEVKCYDKTFVTVLPERKYAVLVRK